MVKDFPFIRQPELVALKAGNVSVADRQKFFEHTWKNKFFFFIPFLFFIFFFCCCFLGFFFWTCVVTAFSRGWKSFFKTVVYRIDVIIVPEKQLSRF